MVLHQWTPYDVEGARSSLIAVHERPRYRAAATGLAAALSGVPGIWNELRADVLEAWKKIAETDPLPEVRRAGR